MFCLVLCTIVGETPLNPSNEQLRGGMFFAFAENTVIKAVFSILCCQNVQNVNGEGTGLQAVQGLRSRGGTKLHSSVLQCWEKWEKEKKN